MNFTVTYLERVHPGIGLRSDALTWNFVLRDVLIQNKKGLMGLEFESFWD